MNFHQDDFTQFRKILFSKVVKIKKNIYKLQHKTPVIYKYKKDTQIILYESFCQNLRSPFLIFNYFRVRAQNGIRKLKISLWLNDMAWYGLKMPETWKNWNLSLYGIHNPYRAGWETVLDLLLVPWTLSWNMELKKGNCWVTQRLFYISIS